MAGRIKAANFLMFFGMLLIFSACATPSDLTQLPPLPKKEAALGLIPQEYLCPGADSAEAPDPKLVREIQVFLE